MNIGICTAGREVRCCGLTAVESFITKQLKKPGDKVKVRGLSNFTTAPRNRMSLV